MDPGRQSSIEDGQLPMDRERGPSWETCEDCVETEPVSVPP